ncbi:M15 family metallopeptidase [Nocardia sp. NPDC056611]|uniref:M15 family metallopeptidase n=1 Tax=Nocardia sp. NPDC056611 TaxID=3345877 RepID=UPI00366F024C
MRVAGPDLVERRRRPAGTRRAAALAVLASAGLVGGSVTVVTATRAAAEQLPDLVDDGIPSAKAVAAGTEGLDPRLAAAFAAAASDADAAGVTLWITSGYRTPGEQEALWEDGLQTYGSPEAARRWVLPPGESTHVTGQAIDVGPIEGAQWLEANGSHWGLCRMYDNEWWHFELATVPDGPCPARLPDASQR